MTRTKTLRFFSTFGLALGAPLLAGGAAHAQDDALALPAVEIGRDVAALSDEIRPRPKDIDVADTILVFTSSNRRVRVVRCVARDGQGQAVGRTLTRVPAHGQSYIRASDISNGQDFVGHVQCSTRGGRIMPTAVFLGPEITDLPAHSR